LSRKKLIKQLKERNPKLNHLELENVINTFCESILNALKNGNNIEIRGFGRWYLRKLKENFNARNPTTNKLIYTPERVKVRFRPSKKLNKIINK
tara:strand:+ start:2640 stop:2921 length:282 start_codon:yes stop_codon:yes gene_type:complete